jgi:small subunit ribosomal protein S13
MARIAGVDLPRDKKVEIGLTHLRHRSEERRRDHQKSGVDAALRVRDLTDADVNKIAARSSASTRSKARSAPKSR